MAVWDKVVLYLDFIWTLFTYERQSTSITTTPTSKYIAQPTQILHLKHISHLKFPVLRYLLCLPFFKATVWHVITLVFPHVSLSRPDKAGDARSLHKAHDEAFD